MFSIAQFSSGYDLVPLPPEMGSSVPCIVKGVAGESRATVESWVLEPLAPGLCLLESCPFPGRDAATVHTSLDLSSRTWAGGSCGALSATVYWSPIIRRALPLHWFIYSALRSARRDGVCFPHLFPVVKQRLREGT